MTFKILHEPKIAVDFKADGHGRLSLVFHLSDCEGKEIALEKKSAVKIAKAILQIVQMSPAAGMAKPSTKPARPEFTTAAALFNFAMADGMSLETIHAKTGFAYPDDIRDLQAAIQALYPDR